jgi:hypothetical protein
LAARIDSLISFSVILLTLSITFLYIFLLIN